MIDSYQNISLIQIISKIFKNLSLRRKKQLGLLSLLVLISSISEVLTLSSIQPFLISLDQTNNNKSLISLLLIFIILSLLNIFSSSTFKYSFINSILIYIKSLFI